MGKISQSRLESEKGKELAMNSKKNKSAGIWKENKLPRWKKKENT